MSRDALVVSSAALLFLAMVGGVLFYKGPTDALRRLSDLEALIQGGGSPTPQPPAVPIDVARHDSEERETKDEVEKDGEPTSEIVMAAAPTADRTDHVATDAPAPFFGATKSPPAVPESEPGLKPDPAPVNDEPAVETSNAATSSVKRTEQETEGSLPPSPPVASSGVPETKRPNVLEELLRKGKQTKPTAVNSVAVADAGDAQEDKLALPDLEPPPPATAKEPETTPRENRDTEAKTEKPAAAEPPMEEPLKKETTVPSSPIPAPPSLESSPYSLPKKPEPKSSPSGLAMPPPPPLAAPSAPTPTPPVDASKEAELTHREVAEPQSFSNSPTVEKDTTPRPSVASKPELRQDRELPHNALPSAPPVAPRAAEPAAMGESDDHSKTLVAEPVRRPEGSLNPSPPTLRTPTEGDGSPSPGIAGSGSVSSRKSVDGPRKVIPAPRTYGSSPYAVSWPNQATKTLPANLSVQSSAAGADAGPAAGAEVTNPSRAIASSNRPLNASNTADVSVAPTVAAGPMEANGASNRVIATAVPLAQGTRAEAMPLTTPGSKLSDPVMEPIASTRARQPEENQPQQNSAEPEPAPKAEEKFILVQSMPSALNTGFAKEQPSEPATVAEPPPAAAKVVSYDVESYVVLPGDSFNSIARSMYKNPAYGPALARYNRSKVPSNETLNSGNRILMPPADVLEHELNKMNQMQLASRAVPPTNAIPRTVAPPASAPEPAAPRELQEITPTAEPAPAEIATNVTKVAPAPVAATVENGTGPISAETNKPTNLAGIPIYTVQKHETLYAIARRTLGDGRRWREIYELNSDRLQSEYDVPIGVSLKLPKDALRR